MAIYKQGNKTLIDNSGLVYTNSDALIDLRSTYGVTKNNSNEVNRAKNYNKSQVFRTQIGNEPIENGDEFECFTSKKYMILKNSPFGLLGTEPWTLNFWTYYEQVSSGSFIDDFKGVGVSNILVFMQFSQLQFNIYYTDGSNQTLGLGSVKTSELLNSWNYFSLSRLSDGTYKTFINGESFNAGGSPNTKIIGSNSELRIGSQYAINAMKIDDITLFKHETIKNFDTPKRSSE